MRLRVVVSPRSGSPTRDFLIAAGAVCIGVYLWSELIAEVQTLIAADWLSPKIRGAVITAALLVVFPELPSVEAGEGGIILERLGGAHT